MHIKLWKPRSDCSKVEGLSGVPRSPLVVHRHGALHDFVNIQVSALVLELYGQPGYVALAIWLI